MADFSTVTEVPGLKVTSQALQMMVTRYAVASRYAKGRAVLEVACGAGQGLGYMARTAASVAGGDLEWSLVNAARDHYRRRVDLLNLDAHHLPFRKGSFDTVVLFEALYYLSDPQKFAQESRRVLREGGVLVICTVNRNWSDFNLSPHSTRYHSAPELFQLLTKQGFETELHGAFSTTTDAMSQKAVSLIKRTAVALRLVPRSMQGKEWLKRIFYGRLTVLPPEVDRELASEEALVPISSKVPTSQYKVLYAIGRAR